MQNKLSAALRSLSDSGVVFIVVGGVAAALNSAPVDTYDVDIVFSKDRENLDRLVRWLDAADAIFRIQPERRLRPNCSHLAAARHLNLLTRYGPVHLLGTIGDNLGFEQLLPLSPEMEIFDGIRIPVLNLETIISIKEKLGFEKDLRALPTLRRTLEEQKRIKS
jgi:predicted nucleotidyltransferase